MPIKTVKVLDITDKDIPDAVKYYLWAHCPEFCNGSYHDMQWGEFGEPCEVPEDFIEEYDRTMRRNFKKYPTFEKAHEMTMSYLKEQGLEQFETFKLLINW